MAKCKYSGCIFFPRRDAKEVAKLLATYFHFLSIKKIIKKLSLTTKRREDRKEKGKEWKKEKNHKHTHYGNFFFAIMFVIFKIY